jgi:hypothetical protein
LNNHQISRQPRPSTIAVRKWMDEDEAVMKTHG